MYANSRYGRYVERRASVKLRFIYKGFDGKFKGLKNGLFNLFCVYKTDELAWSKFWFYRILIFLFFQIIVTYEHYNIEVSILETILKRYSILTFGSHNNLKYSIVIQNSFLYWIWKNEVERLKQYFDWEWKFGYSLILL